MNKKAIRRDVSIIIINWNGWEDTLECLESLTQIDYPNYYVVVVDNNSDDDSVNKIREYCEGNLRVKSAFFSYNPQNKPLILFEYSKEEFDAGIKIETDILELPSDRKMVLIKNNENHGFAAGNNMGIEYSLKTLNTDYILLLNNDTVVDKDFLNKIVDVAESEDKIGIVGPTILFYNDPNKIQSAGADIIWNKGEIKKNRANQAYDNQIQSPINVDYIEGCALLAKSELFNKIGYLDTKYFLYWEDTDWCIRASKAGYHIVNVPQAKIWHKLGSSSTKINDLYVYYLARNSLWFMRKYANRKQFTLLMFYFFGFYFWFTSAIYLIYHRDKILFNAFLRGTKDGFKL